MTASRRLYSDSDLEAVRQRHRLSDMVGATVSLRRRGREYVGLCPFHAEKTPSFTVNDAKGFFHCFGCGAHGDVIAFYIETRGVDFPTAVRDLAGDRLANPKANAAAAAEARRRERDEARRAALRQASALEIFTTGVSIRGSLAEAYLRGRGITIGLPSALRFQPKLDYWPPGRGEPPRPAMVAAVTSPRGEVTGVHMTWLNDDGTKHSKTMKGAIAGGVVRLGPVFDNAVGLAEGIESALAATQFFMCPSRRREYGVPQEVRFWAALSAGGMAAARFPPSYQPDAPRRIILAPDSDLARPNPTKADGRPEWIWPGPDAADRAARFLTAQGRRVDMIHPPLGLDWNDVLTRVMQHDRSFANPGAVSQAPQSRPGPWPPGDRERRNQ